jgi:hypothetical protein
MLASIVEELVRVFNWRLQYGQRRSGKNIPRTLEDPWPTFQPEATPSWTSLVPPVQEEDMRELPSNMIKNGRLFLADGGCENFERHNFTAPTQYLYKT